MIESPLTEADPQSLNILFDKDPLELTDQDIDAIVAELRKARTEWATEESSKSKSKASKVTANLSLEDLDLKL